VKLLSLVIICNDTTGNNWDGDDYLVEIRCESGRVNQQKQLTKTVEIDKSLVFETYDEGCAYSVNGYVPYDNERSQYQLNKTSPRYYRYQEVTQVREMPSTACMQEWVNDTVEEIKKVRQYMNTSTPERQIQNHLALLKGKASKSWLK